MSPLNVNLVDYLVSKGKSVKNIDPKWKRASLDSALLEVGVHHRELFTDFLHNVYNQQLQNNEGGNEMRIQRLRAYASFLEQELASASKDKVKFEPKTDEEKLHPTKYDPNKAIFDLQNVKALLKKSENAWIVANDADKANIELYVTSLIKNCLDITDNKVFDGIHIKHGVFSFKELIETITAEIRRILNEQLGAKDKQELLSQIEQMTTQLKTYAEQQKILEDRIRISNTDIDKLQKLVADLQNRPIRGVDQAVGNAAAQAQVNNEAEQLRQQVGQLNQQIADLQNQLAQARAANAEQAQRQLEERINQLQNELNQAQAQANVVDRPVPEAPPQLEARINRLQAELQQAQEQLAQAQQQAAQPNNVEQQLRQQIADLQAQLAQAQQHAGQPNNADVDQLRQQIADLQNRLAQAGQPNNAEADQLHQQIADLQAQLAQAQQAQPVQPNDVEQQLRQQIADLQNQLAQAQAAQPVQPDVDQLRQQVQNLQNELNQARNALINVRIVPDAQDAAQDIQTLINNIRDRYDAAVYANTLAKTQIENLSYINNAIRLQVEHVKARQRDAERLNAQQRQDLIDRNNALQLNFDNLQAEAQRLRALVDQFRASTINYGLALHRLRVHHDDIVNQRLQEQMNEFDQQLNEEHEKIAQLNEEIAINHRAFEASWSGKQRQYTHDNRDMSLLNTFAIIRKMLNAEEIKPVINTLFKIVKYRSEADFNHSMIYIHQPFLMPILRNGLIQHVEDPGVMTKYSLNKDEYSFLRWISGLTLADLMKIFTKYSSFQNNGVSQGKALYEALQTPVNRFFDMINQFYTGRVYPALTDNIMSHVFSDEYIELYNSLYYARNGMKQDIITRCDEYVEYLNDEAIGENEQYLRDMEVAKHLFNVIAFVFKESNAGILKACAALQQDLKSKHISYDVLTIRESLLIDQFKMSVYDANTYFVSEVVPQNSPLYKKPNDTKAAANRYQNEHGSTYPGLSMEFLESVNAQIKAIPISNELVDIIIGHNDDNIKIASLIEFINDFMTNADEKVSHLLFGELKDVDIQLHNVGNVENFLGGTIKGFSQLAGKSHYSNEQYNIPLSESIANTVLCIKSIFESEAFKTIFTTCNSGDESVDKANRGFVSCYFGKYRRLIRTVQRLIMFNYDSTEELVIRITSSLQGIINNSAVVNILTYQLFNFIRTGNSEMKFDSLYAFSTLAFNAVCNTSRQLLKNDSEVNYGINNVERLNIQGGGVIDGETCEKAISYLSRITFDNDDYYKLIAKVGDQTWVDELLGITDRELQLVPNDKEECKLALSSIRPLLNVDRFYSQLVEYAKFLLKNVNVINMFLPTTLHRPEYMFRNNYNDQNIIDLLENDYYKDYMDLEGIRSVVLDGACNFYNRIINGRVWRDEDNADNSAINTKRQLPLIAACANCVLSNVVSAICDFDSSFIKSYAAFAINDEKINECIEAIEVICNRMWSSHIDEKEVDALKHLILIATEYTFDYIRYRNDYRGSLNASDEVYNILLNSNVGHQEPFVGNEDDLGVKIAEQVEGEQIVNDIVTLKSLKKRVEDVLWYNQSNVYNNYSVLLSQIHHLLMNSNTGFKHSRLLAAGLLGGTLNKIITALKYVTECLKYGTDANYQLGDIDIVEDMNFAGNRHQVDTKVDLILRDAEDKISRIDPNNAQRRYVCHGSLPPMSVLKTDKNSLMNASIKWTHQYFKRMSGRNVDGKNDDIAEQLYTTLFLLLMNIHQSSCHIDISEDIAKVVRTIAHESVNIVRCDIVQEAILSRLVNLCNLLSKVKENRDQQWEQIKTDISDLFGCMLSDDLKEGRYDKEYAVVKLIAEYTFATKMDMSVIEKDQFKRLYDEVPTVGIFNRHKDDKLSKYLNYKVVNNCYPLNIFNKVISVYKVKDWVPGTENLPNNEVYTPQAKEIVKRNRIEVQRSLLDLLPMIQAIRGNTVKRENNLNSYCKLAKVALTYYNSALYPDQDFQAAISDVLYTKFTRQISESRMYTQDDQKIDFSNVMPLINMKYRTVLNPNHPQEQKDVDITKSMNKLNLRNIANARNDMIAVLDEYEQSVDELIGAIDRNIDDFIRYYNQDQFEEGNMRSLMSLEGGNRADADKLDELSIPDFAFSVVENARAYVKFVYRLCTIKSLSNWVLNTDAEQYERSQTSDWLDSFRELMSAIKRKEWHLVEKFFMFKLDQFYRRFRRGDDDPLQPAQVVIELDDGIKGMFQNIYREQANDSGEYTNDAGAIVIVGLLCFYVDGSYNIWKQSIESVVSKDRIEDMTNGLEALFVRSREQGQVVWNANAEHIRTLCAARVETELDRKYNIYIDSNANRKTSAEIIITNVKYANEIYSKLYMNCIAPCLMDTIDSIVNDKRLSMKKYKECLGYGLSEIMSFRLWHDKYKADLDILKQNYEAIVVMPNVDANALEWVKENYLKAIERYNAMFKISLSKMKTYFPTYANNNPAPETIQQSHEWLENIDENVIQRLESLIHIYDSVKVDLFRNLGIGMYKTDKAEINLLIEENIEVNQNFKPNPFILLMRAFMLSLDSVVDENSNLNFVFACQILKPCIHKYIYDSLSKLALKTVDKSRIERNLNVAKSFYGFPDVEINNIERFFKLIYSVKSHQRSYDDESENVPNKLNNWLYNWYIVFDPTLPNEIYVEDAPNWEQAPEIDNALVRVNPKPSNAEQAERNRILARTRLKKYHEQLAVENVNLHQEQQRNKQEIVNLQNQMVQDRNNNIEQLRLAEERWNNVVTDLQHQNDQLNERFHQAAVNAEQAGKKVNELKAAIALKDQELVDKGHIVEERNRIQRQKQDIEQQLEAKTQELNHAIEQYNQEINQLKEDAKNKVKQLSREKKTLQRQLRENNDVMNRNLQQNTEALKACKKRMTQMVAAKMNELGSKVALMKQNNELAWSQYKEACMRFMESKKAELDRNQRKLQDEQEHRVELEHEIAELTAELEREKNASIGNLKVYVKNEKEGYDSELISQFIGRSIIGLTSADLPNVDYDEDVKLDYVPTDEEVQLKSADYDRFAIADIIEAWRRFDENYISKCNQYKQALDGIEAQYRVNSNLPTSRKLKIEYEALIRLKTDTEQLRDSYANEAQQLNPGYDKSFTSVMYEVNKARVDYINEVLNKMKPAIDEDNLRQNKIARAVAQAEWLPSIRHYIMAKKVLVRYCKLARMLPNECFSDDDTYLNLAAVVNVPDDNNLNWNAYIARRDNARQPARRAEPPVVRREQNMQALSQGQIGRPEPNRRVARSVSEVGRRDLLGNVPDNGAQQQIPQQQIPLPEANNQQIINQNPVVVPQQQQIINQNPVVVPQQQIPQQQQQIINQNPVVVPQQQIPQQQQQIINQNPLLEVNNQQQRGVQQPDALPSPGHTVAAIVRNDGNSSSSSSSSSSSYDNEEEEVNQIRPAPNRNLNRQFIPNRRVINNASSSSYDEEEEQYVPVRPIVQPNRVRANDVKAEVDALNYLAEATGLVDTYKSKLDLSLRPNFAAVITSKPYNNYKLNDALQRDTQAYNESRNIDTVRRILDAAQYDIIEYGEAGTFKYASVAICKLYFNNLARICNAFKLIETEQVDDAKEHFERMYLILKVMQGRLVNAMSVFNELQDNARAMISNQAVLSVIPMIYTIQTYLPIWLVMVNKVIDYAKNNRIGDDVRKHLENALGVYERFYMFLTKRFNVERVNVRGVDISNQQQLDSINEWLDKVYCDKLANQVNVIKAIIDQFINAKIVDRNINAAPAAPPQQQIPQQQVINQEPEAEPRQQQIINNNEPEAIPIPQQQIPQQNPLPEVNNQQQILQQFQRRPEDANNPFVVLPNDRLHGGIRHEPYIISAKMTADKAVVDDDKDIFNLWLNCALFTRVDLQCNNDNPDQPYVKKNLLSILHDMVPSTDMKLYLQNRALNEALSRAPYMEEINLGETINALPPNLRNPQVPIEKEYYFDDAEQRRIELRQPQVLHGGNSALNRQNELIDSLANHSICSLIIFYNDCYDEPERAAITYEEKQSIKSMSLVMKILFWVLAISLIVLIVYVVVKIFRAENVQIKHNTKIRALKLRKTSYYA